MCNYCEDADSARKEDHYIAKRLRRLADELDAYSRVAFRDDRKHMAGSPAVEKAREVRRSATSLVRHLVKAEWLL